MMKVGHKRFFIRYESDKMICGSYDHFGGNASTIKSAKSIINSIKQELVMDNPRNFRVYDTESEIDKSTNFVKCVYQNA